MNRYLRLLPILLLILISGSAFAQSGAWTLSGTVVDGSKGDSIPYASVIVKSAVTQNMLTGTTTDDLGYFSLACDSSDILIEISFIGYQTMTLTDLDWSGNAVDLGSIAIEEDNTTLGEVEITHEKSTMEFKLDKRVFNVGKDISSTGMGALEVLNNVPSVSVDIEGQIRLRGNQGVQILIDGKPSVLSDDPANALSSITADMIEKIEIITNPSAKYDAEGTSGILNIVLKKEEKKGVNGSASINAGWPHNHSLGASINLRTKRFNFFTQFGAGYRSLPTYVESVNTDRTTGSRIESDGIRYRNENFYNITLGTDYYINKYNTLTLSGNFAYEIEKQPSHTEFFIYDEAGLLTSQSKRTETTDALNPKWQYDVQYEKQFKNHKDHKLQFSTLGRFFGKDQSSNFTNEDVVGGNAGSDQRTQTEFYQASYTFKLDYMNPITEAWSIEAGSMYDINDVGNDYAVFDAFGTDWIVDSSLTNNFEWDQKVLGAYFTGAYEGKKWGVKLGLRTENTDLKTLQTATGEDNHRNYTNLFPTVHTSYKFTKSISVQAGYSRRIFRPRLWDLNPFFNIQNVYNIRTGNPNLQPEYADSYELTSIFIFKKASLNASVYYLYTTNIKETISYFQNEVTISRPENVGVKHKVGVEVNGKVDLAKWLTMNGDFNYGYFIREGEFEGQNFDFTGNQWSSKLTAKFKIPAGIDLEISGNYESSSRTVQGEVSGFIFADMGIRKKLWKGKGVVNLAVRDIFASRIRERTVDQATYSLYDFSKRGRFITAGFSYSFGKGEAMTYSGGRHH